VQSLNSNTESRARQILENVRDEGDKQINYEKRQIESRISAVEDACRVQKAKNEDLIRRIEDCEREGNSRINEERNQIYYMKDQLSREKNEDNRSKQVLAEFSRKLGEMEKEKARIQIEERMLKTKRDNTELEKRQEIDSLKGQLAAEERRMQDNISSLRKREQDIDEKIVRARQDFNLLQGRHREVKDKIQIGLQSTLTNTLGQYNFN
jgi:chromosome segregation ATPase